MLRASRVVPVLVVLSALALFAWRSAKQNPLAEFEARQLAEAEAAIDAPRPDEVAFVFSTSAAASPFSGIDVEEYAQETVARGTLPGVHFEWRLRGAAAKLAAARLQGPLLPLFIPRARREARADGAFVYRFLMLEAVRALGNEPPARQGDFVAPKEALEVVVASLDSREPLVRRATLALLELCHRKVTTDPRLTRALVDHVKALAARPADPENALELGASVRLLRRLVGHLYYHVVKSRSEDEQVISLAAPPAWHVLDSQQENPFDPDRRVFAPTAGVQRRFRLADVIVDLENWLGKHRAELGEQVVALGPA